MGYFYKHCTHFCSILTLINLDSWHIRKSPNSLCSGAESMIGDSLMQKTSFFPEYSAKFNPSAAGADALLIVTYPKPWRPPRFSGWVWPGLKSSCWMLTSTCIFIKLVCRGKKAPNKPTAQTFSFLFSQLFRLIWWRCERGRGAHLAWLSLNWGWQEFILSWPNFYQCLVLSMLNRTWNRGNRA